MKTSITGIILVLAAATGAPGQGTDSPKFVAADVHVSAKSTNTTPFPTLRGAPLSDGIYQAKGVTMVDLIQRAYGLTPEKILGGPNWLELDHFDVIAKAPQDTSPEALKQMMQALLEERFKLVTHKDTRPMPAYALVAGKKPQLKEATGTGEPGCKPQADSPIAGGMAIKVGAQVAASMGMPTTINLGPGGTLQYNCRNMTMAAFADNLQSLGGGRLGTNPVADATGLTGKWNFELRITYLSMPGNDAERITIFDAVDKQLGLKLEERQVPLPVLVVDRVNREPIANPAGTAAALPAVTAPTSFEVASVKPAISGQPLMNRFQVQPGGHFILQQTTLRFLVNHAFNTRNNEQIAGLPAWADSEAYNIDAKSPVAAPSGPVDYDWSAPMLRSMLVERFAMTYHTEDRPVTAYALVQAKPKMKKADPDSRISCKSPMAPTPSSRVITCQNTTMAQLAERLQGMTQELVWPVADSTELAGGWDFTLVWTPDFGPAGGRGGDAAAGTASASDPSGGLTLYEALEKQLGLKLEKQKRPMPIIVIDHIEQKPTEN
jgi:uncharacterized protein (TIGR03435 family)